MIYKELGFYIKSRFKKKGLTQNIVFDLNCDLQKNVDTKDSYTKI